MRRKVWAGILTPVVVLGGLGAYAWADAEDLVPGVLTTAEEKLPPAPFLSAEPVAAVPPTEGPVTNLDGDAPQPTKATIDALAKKLRDDERTGDSTNVSVLDYVTGEYLGGISPADSQVPASTTKLLTAAAALHALGPDFTTTTEVTWDPGTATLTLVAGGDLMLAAGDGHHGVGHEDDLDEANGWAGLGDLAQMVRTELGDSAPAAVNVAVDDTAFPGPAWPEAWPEYARVNGYAAPVTGIAVNVARLEGDGYGPRHDDPSLAAADDFAQALAAAGFTVDDVDHGTTPADAAVVASVESAPLSLVTKYFLAVSDNTISEVVARVLALETGQAVNPSGAAAATIAQLRDMGVDTDGLALFDGAGFSENNRIAPSQLTSTIVASRTDPHNVDLVNYMALGGLEGTVEARYEGTSAAGYVRAKTGSLTGVTTLAGIVTTADGRVLAFATMADGMPYGQSRPMGAIDDFVTALADCGCQ
ncbi:D-alanyl-D-alanine carboxypeptidase/D-alanyl-D-alanine endopeptidase [Demequina aurantiaca]|uniref:D-alanyl-D-alanine carboxypeptidase/D-alanyl-D-alanine endopeptidase n=1 Tax=Demequina aurantiaca TaxID=676200 RepID=UPI000AB05032|nr:D-alanyl-D-alanine carboxypeptidase/D-alanyl-D-alanine-endopeptidase [Demequina aurantiaca]